MLNNFFAVPKLAVNTVSCNNHASRGYIRYIAVLGHVNACCTSIAGYNTALNI